MRAVATLLPGLRQLFQIISIGIPKLSRSLRSVAETTPL
jgi:hypothetical protein